MNFLSGKFAEQYDCTTLGARSEHISFSDSDNAWQGEVVHAENLGSDNYLFVEIGANQPVVVRQDGKSKIDIGSQVSIEPHVAHLYRFDANGQPQR